MPSAASRLGGAGFAGEVMMRRRDYVAGGLGRSYGIGLREKPKPFGLGAGGRFESRGGRGKLESELG
jgi:hypothetical protein